MKGSSPVPPKLVMTLSIPNEIQRLMRILSQDYLSILNFIPPLMEDRLSNLVGDSLPISCMVWNVQGQKVEFSWRS